MARQQTLAAPRENCWNKPTSSPHSTERATPVEVGGASAPIQLPLNEGLPSSGRRKSPSQARRTQLQDANLLFWHTVVPLQLLICGGRPPTDTRTTSTTTSAHLNYTCVSHGSQRREVSICRLEELV